jgi:hypothetical protein
MEIYTLFAVHLIALLLGSVLFAMSLHYNLLGGVFFYRGIILLFLVSVLVSILVFMLKNGMLSELLNGRDVVLVFLSIFSLNLVFFTHVPVTADRSITIFILGYMNDHSTEALSEQQVTDFFIKRYIHDYHAIQRRFDEQIVSGNVENTPQGYKITNRGKRLIDFYRIVADIYGVDKRFISPS